MESIIWTEENGYQLIETDDDGNVTVLGSGETPKEAVDDGTN